VVVLGLSQLLEGEQDAEEGLAPGVHSQAIASASNCLLFKSSCCRPFSTGTPVILVLINGARWLSIGPTSMCRLFWKRGIPVRRAAAIAEAIFVDQSADGCRSRSIAPRTCRPSTTTTCSSEPIGTLTASRCMRLVCD
jgi:hypothetical protein